MTVGLFAVTSAGRLAATRLAAALGPNAVVVDGPIGASLRASLRARWPNLTGAVLFLAAGAAVRLVAPLLVDERTDPAVVCVDEACCFAVSLVGAGADDLAERVAVALGCTVVPNRGPLAGSGALVIGVGSARGVPADAVTGLLERLAGERGLDLRDIRCFATIDLKAREPGILAAVRWWADRYGLTAPALRTYPAESLAAVAVPNPSEVVRAEVGTPSVAEAAALRAAAELAPGAPVELVVPKIKGDNVTLAAARVSTPH